MGWIAERHMKQGGSLNKNPSRQRRGPLRRIVADIKSSEGMFDRALVELECGHRVHSDAIYQARCDKCSQDQHSAKGDGQ